MRKFARIAALGVSAASLLGLSVFPCYADVTFERLLHADAEPQNWLMINGDYASHRYSTLDQINRKTVKNLKLAYTVALGGNEAGGELPRAAMEANPLIEDGFMYLTDGWSEVYKIDVRSGHGGKIVWKTDPGEDKAEVRLPVNRGLAFWKDLVIIVSGDGHVLGLRKDNGRIVQDLAAKVDPAEIFTGAPMVLKDKVIFGASGGDFAVRGWIGAVDLNTWKLSWRFYSVPAPGEPGSETWKDDHQAWKTGGGAVWAMGAYDPATDRLFWGTGNPNPSYDQIEHPGDNLYTNSTIVLDAETGKLAWYYQYTPNDPFDYDETGGNMLLTTQIDGKPHDVLSHYARNGFVYTLDRATGKFLKGGQYVSSVNWTKGLNPETGKPLEYDPTKDVQLYATGAQPLRGKGLAHQCPDQHGGTSYWPPAYSPLTKHIYAGIWEGCGEEEIIPGKFMGGAHTNKTPVSGAIVSVDPATAKVLGRYPTVQPNVSGITATAGHLIFTATEDGIVMALDDETLKPLYTFETGTIIGAPPVVFAVDGKEYMAILAGGPLLPRLSGPFANPDLYKVEGSSMLYVFAL